MAIKKKVSKELPEVFSASREYRLHSLVQSFAGCPTEKSEYEFKVGALVRLKSQVTGSFLVRDKTNAYYGQAHFQFFEKGACGTVIAINQRSSPLQLDKKTSFQPMSEAFIMFGDGDLIIDMAHVVTLLEVVLPG